MTNPITYLDGWVTKQRNYYNKKRDTASLSDWDDGYYEGVMMMIDKLDIILTDLEDEIEHDKSPPHVLKSGDYQLLSMIAEKIREFDEMYGRQPNVILFNKETFDRYGFLSNIKQLFGLEVCVADRFSLVNARVLSD